MKINRLIAGVIALVAGAAGLFAQNGTISPYSRYGYGLISDNVTSTQGSMGGVGYAMTSGRQVNVMNPASYARTDSLTFLFDMGMDMSALWTSETNGTTHNSDRNFGAGLSYITMQFPINKRMGMSLGLLPYSSVGYAFGSDIDNGASSRSGDGSINQLYAGVSGRIFGGLTVGVNMSYLFGSTNNYSYATAEAGDVSLYRREISVRDWHLTAGLQYSQPIGNDMLTLGFVYSPAKAFLGHARTYVQNINTDDSQTEQSSAKLKDGYSMAATYGAGIGYQLGQKLFLEGDFTYQPWSKEKFNGVEGALADRYKIALGAQYQGAQRGSYWRRIQYRLGAFYDRDYLVVGDNNVRQYGASFGLGLPVPGFKTVVNLGFEWRHRQATPAALVKEDYLNITIGINFNEMWFRKNKIY